MKKSKATKLMIPFYKLPGETPLQAIERLKKDHPELQAFPMTYAGRLDPLAEGLLLVLVGDECKQKDKYLRLPKEYAIEVAFGIRTDTGDALGIPEVSPEFPYPLHERDIAKAVKALEGRHKQPYPAYSSKPVKGKPLFFWARAGRLGEIEIPVREIEIYKAMILNINEADFSELVDQIIERIKNVSGDFRQKEIIASWEKEKSKHRGKRVQIVALKVQSSSGTYMRSVAAVVGQNLKTHAFAASILRTAVGTFRL